MIIFLPLGGAGEIGASCFYLNISGTGIILDCGMHPQKKGLEALPKFDFIEDQPIDYVLISHAHQDHLSALPFLVKRHPYIKIVTTPQTRALAELTLHDSISIWKEQLNEEEIKIYSHEEIDLLIQSIEYKAYNEGFFIKGYNGNEEIKITFYDAGHVLGSAGILIELNDQRIFYTGDINLTSQALIKGADLPLGKIDTLIIESTYGATISTLIPKWTDEAKRFSAEASKILNNGGSILIPAFSLGKTQEMLKTIWKLMERKELTQAAIYSGGISTKINRVYDYNRYVVNMTDNDFELASIPKKNLYEVDDPTKFFKEPCIVIASSGMMIEGTASYRLALKWIKQTGSAIFTVGYMEESTPGYKFANAIKGGKIRLSEYGKEEEVKCSIKKFRFPSHSKREELLEIVKRLKPDKAIIVHGNLPAIDWMGNSILKELKNIKVHAAEIGKEIVI